VRVMDKSWVRWVTATAAAAEQSGLAVELVTSHIVYVECIAIRSSFFIPTLDIHCITLQAAEPGIVTWSLY
jgi:hypothetical protein